MKKKFLQYVYDRAFSEENQKRLDVFYVAVQVLLTLH